jgi:uncharacterized protein YdhG (YjbR/CyaY superfamily)
MTTFTDIDSYISLQQEHIQPLLETLRQTIKTAAPDAKEVISYNMPAFQQDGGVLVYFAAYKAHIGFYPTGSGIEHFKDELDGFNWSKGAIQFPIDKPMPLALVKRIVKFRIKMNKEKAMAKAAAKNNKKKTNDRGL